MVMGTMFIQRKYGGQVAHDKILLTKKKIEYENI